MSKITFYTTPFHINNRPDSVATLVDSATATSGEITYDCLPLTGPITVDLTRSDVSNCDTCSYAKIKYDNDVNTYFAVVASRVPISADTYRFTLVLDGLLTCLNKGITKVEGMTERVHVAKSSDTLGAYVEEDDLLGCAQPLEVVSERMYTGADYDGTDGYTVLAATFDVFKMGDPTYTEALEFINTGSSNSVNVPDIPALRRQNENISKKQYVQIPIAENNTIVYKNIVSPAIDYFSGDDPANNACVKGCSVAHSLGASDGIVAQYTIPKGFTGYPNGITINSGRIADSTTGDYFLKGAYHQTASNLNFEHSTVQNKRLLVGKMNTYGITAVASGENGEFNPEDLLKNASGTVQTAPVVECFTDPRETGLPSFRFKFVNGSHDMERGLIKGLQWQNVPLVNAQREGYGLEKFKFMNDGILQEKQFSNKETKSFVDLITGAFNASNADDAGSKFGELQLAQSALGFMGSTAKNVVDLNYAKKARQVEANEIVVENKLVAPNMKFNFHPSIRDAVGNGVLVYRFKPSAADLTRLDKILNMYGYRVTKPLEISDFSNRSRYNYIKASGVHITCDLPSYIVEQAESDLMAGVRLWHVSYDGNYTTANN